MQSPRGRSFLVEADGEDVARGRVQHRVLGEVEQDRDAVPLAAAITIKSMARVCARRTTSVLMFPVCTSRSQWSSPSFAASSAMRNRARSTSSPSICTAGSSASPIGSTGTYSTTCSNVSSAPNVAASALARSAIFSLSSVRSRQSRIFL